jgi:glycosyltransferase involved in cell wall biosynthesis
MTAAHVGLQGTQSRLFAPAASYRRPIRRILVLHRGASPTAELYLRPRFTAAEVPVAFQDMLQPLPDAGLAEGTFVVLVRYLNVPYARALWAARERLSGVVYLMDDDIPGAARDHGLPPDYRRTVGLFWTVFKPILARLASEIWVTSPGLEHAYGGANVHRIDPLYLGPAAERTPAESEPNRPVRIFYHGGRTHRADQLWLRDVIEKVQKARDDTVFEIFGDEDVARSYAGIPRCRVLQRMRWPDYLSYACSERLDVGLAPAVAGTYNAARSFNKAYDITRTGAAGVYADVPSFREFVTDGREGMLVPADDQDAWVAAILALVDDPDRRRRLHAAALARARQIAERELTAPLIARFKHADAPRRE